MYIWQKVIVLIVSLTLFVFGHNDTNWRTYYITPLSNESLIGCPVDHCYSLQDIFNNQSHFFASNTTLELLPGRYDIIESVGQLVIANVSNFRIEGVPDSMESITIIKCLSGASLGFAFVSCENVNISNIQFSHCSANLNLDVGLANYTVLISNIITVLTRHLEQNFSSCESQSHTLCHNFLASFSNTKISLHRTTITYTKGIGVLGLGNRDFSISSSCLAYNEVNCVNFVIDVPIPGSSFSIFASDILFGRTEHLNLASGLNLFVLLQEQAHRISISSVTLKNNIAQHGNFYIFLDVNAVSDIDIIVDIGISEVTSIQERKKMSGIVITFNIDLEWSMSSHYIHYSSQINSPLYYNNMIPTSSCTISYNTPKLRRSSPPTTSWSSYKCNNEYHSRRISIVLQNSFFIGSCVTIKDSKVLRKDGTLNFEMKNININESKCSVALSIADSDMYENFEVSDLSIINSYNDIMLVSISSHSLVLTGNISFLSNQGSVSILRGTIVFRGTVNLSDNTARKYESALQLSESCNVSFQGQTSFINNSGIQGGAISADHSSLYFSGNASFIGNFAKNGGAISLKDGSIIYLKGDVHMVFTANIATMYGGAIYVTDTDVQLHKTKCFIQSSDDSSSHSVEFDNNTAGIAGSALFGGWIDICKTSNDIKPNDFLDFKGENSVSSIPIGVCICINSAFDRHRNETQIEVFPGQTFEIEVVAVGQRFGVVPATVRAESRFDIINDLQQVQETENHCTKLRFTVRSSRSNETLLLNVDRQELIERVPNGNFAEYYQFKVVIYLNSCPVGFVFDENKNTCSCQQYLLNNRVQCNFSSYTVNRNAQQWIGLMPPTMNIVIHNHCPYDYCKSNALFLNLSISDEQCSFNRSGILCGRCQHGLSHVLGTSNCKRCSNWWLLLTLVFALAGVALVAGLMLFNITVSTGTINGLIFYANIVRVNSAVFFPRERANTFLSLFIAWLNLDLGIETCFYDGLDAYAKTWLQLAFPLYIWFLVAVVIISCRHLKRAANLCGNNPVQVMATLFLLSYAKLLRVTITVFQPTHLLEHQKVWHYDGNIAYLGKRHAPLMFTALLLFVVFFIPYTLILFAIQWLQPFSHYKIFGWINQFKPLFDAYTGPYKDNHRYWTGLLLLVRIALFTVFSTNTSGDPAINLLAIIVTIVCLFAYLALFAGVYKVCLLNILEYSFLLNLIILSVGVLYATSVDNKPVYMVTQISVVVSLCITLIIIAYHSFNVVLKVLKLDKGMCKIPWNMKSITDNKFDTSVDSHTSALNHEVTHSSIELKEPLLEY